MAGYSTLIWRSLLKTKDVETTMGDRDYFLVGSLTSDTGPTGMRARTREYLIAKEDFVANIVADSQEIFGYTNKAAFPVTGALERMYIDEALTEAWLWDGAAYIAIGSGIENVVEDLTPELGGDLDALGNNITNVGLVALDLTADVSVSQGQMAWNADEETFDVGLNGATLQMGQEIHYHVRNNSGSLINNGQAVMSVGTLGASGRILIDLMNNDGSSEPYYFLGVATEDIADGTNGKITEFGKVRGIQTNGGDYSETWVDGELLYLHPSTLGGLTKVQPPSPAHKSPVVIVIHAHATNGTFFIRSNYSQGLHESHDVEITSLTDNDHLVYNLANLRWENTAVGIADFSPLTTKGDLYGYSTEDIRIPVGANGSYLTADSTEAAGVKWASITPSTNTVVVQYTHTSGNALLDIDNYYIGSGTTMGNTINASGQIPIASGTLVAAYISTYNAGTFGTSEAATLNLLTENDTVSTELSTSVLFDARHNYLAVTGLSVSLNAGLSVLELITPSYATNPTSAKMTIILYIEL